MSAAAENKATAARFVDRMNAGDLDGAFALFQPDGTWFTLSSRQHRPLPEMRRAIEWVYTSVMQGPIQLEVSVMTADDDRVAAVCSGSAVTLDGVPYENLYHLLFECHDRLIARLWEFNDTALIREVFGRVDDRALRGEGAAGASQ